MIIPKLKAPIVLVHGLFGFSRFQMGGTTLSYFPGIWELLEAAGNTVRIPALHPVGGVPHRAEELKQFLLKNLPDEPVHLIAHSMGGLDSRYMISRLGMAERVLSLTTLGTPHQGSPIADLATAGADWIVGQFDRVLRPIFDAIPHQAFYDLTAASCRRFNEEVPRAANVSYYSVAARYDGSLCSPEWLPTYLVVQMAEGENDGVVSVKSAQFGDGFEIWEGDHLSLVNWFHPLAKNRTVYRDPAPRYGQLIRRLADLGF